jgi:hypothetical protein
MPPTLDSMNLDTKNIGMVRISNSPLVAIQEEHNDLGSKEATTLRFIR